MQFEAYTELLQSWIQKSTHFYNLHNDSGEYKAVLTYRYMGRYLYKLQKKP